MFQNNQVKGPFDVDDLSQVPGFSAEALVCSEGRKGTNMGDWQRASMIPELSVALLKASQLAVASVGKGAGGFYPGLPPEPTLKDLAQLGSLQERVSLLDGTISQLQENLHLKENDLLCVHRELEEKTRQAGELAIKLGQLEERLSAINTMQSSLDKTAAAEQELEGTLNKQSQTIAELTAQIQVLQTESAQLRTESDQLKTESAELKAKEGEIGELRTQLEELKNRPAPEAPAPPAAKRSMDAPTPLSPEPSPFAPKSDPTPFSPKSEPSPFGAPTPLGLEGLQPAAGEKLTPLMEPKAEAKPLQMLGEPAPSSLSAPPPPPVSGLGMPSPAPAPLPFSPLSSPSPFGLDTPSGPAPFAPAGAVTPAPVATPAATAPPKKGGIPKPVLAAVVIVALGGAFAFKKGLIGGKKAAPVVEVKPLPPPPPVPAAPKPPTPEEIADQHKKEAIELVRAWPVPGGLQTLGQVLEGRADAPSALSSWMAEPIKDDLFQVNYYPKPGAGTTFEFQADLAAKKVIAHNEPAASILTPKEKKVNKPKIKPKGAAAKRTGKERSKGILQDLLSVPADDESGADDQSAAPAKAGKKSKPRNVNKEVDDLLGGATGSPSKPAAAPKKDESLDDLLVPGSSSGGDIQEPAASPSADDEEPAAKPAPKPAKKSGKTAGKPADAELLDDLLKP